MFFSLITKESRINTNLFVLQCVLFCRVLDLSCSLCPSIILISARFHFKLMLWCSSSLVDWWEYSSIYCWTALRGASLKAWLLWEEPSLKEEQICQKFESVFLLISHIKHLCLPAINCIYVSVTITNSWFLSLYPHSMMEPSYGSRVASSKKTVQFFVCVLFFVVLRVRCY